MGDMIKIGRLWKGTTTGGKSYLSGVTVDTLDKAVELLHNGGRLMVFGNDRKREGKKDPDCELFAVPPKEKA